MRLIKSSLRFLPLAVLGVAACLTPTDDTTKGDPFEDIAFGGKSDMLDKAHFVKDIDLSSRISGTFDRRMRVLGFTVEAKKGAVLNVTHESLAGDDSFDVEPGTALDTVVAFYGPMTNGKKGDKLAYADDNDETMAAQLGDVEIPEDGRYVFLLTSWDDPGAGRFHIDVSCAGTEFQCRKPVEDVPCKDGTEYIVGGGPIATTTWGRCNYVLLENTRVEEDAILTIEPGVTVSGNFLDDGEPGGSVHFDVHGTLQSVGTEKHPVVFTALKDMWGGLRLLGSDNHLENVFVEKADVGIEIHGQNNDLVTANINTSNLGVRFEDGSLGNAVNGLRITQVTNGISIGAAGVTIQDSVIVGHGAEGVGIDGDRTVTSDFRRALVTGFGLGIRLHASEFVMVDSSITKNADGVYVTGDEKGVDPGLECPAAPRVTPPSRPRRPPVATWWPRDPYFVHTDVVNNTGTAIFLDAPELLVVENCNVTGNGAGIVVRANDLHDESRIVGSNLHDNGEGAVQLDTAHVHGTLNISGNYWAEISDPELSASWLTSHTESEECRTNISGNPSGCTRHSNARDYTCGAYRCTGPGNWTFTCTATVSNTWDSEVDFTGFSPISLEEAGPRKPLSDIVNEVREEVGLDPR